MKAIEKIFGTHSERELKRIYPLIDKIESYRPAMQELTDEQLKDKTKEFKKRDLLMVRHWTICFRKHMQPFVRRQKRVLWNGTLPCSADWWYYPASGTYR